MVRFLFKRRNIEVLYRYYTESKALKQIPIIYDGKTPLGDKTVSLREHTLTGRLLLYLHNENENKCKQIPESNLLGKYENYNITNSILKEVLNTNYTNLDQLKLTDITDAIFKLNDCALTRTRNGVKQLLNAIDVTCVLHINNLSTNEIFHILHAFINVLPNSISELQFYKHAIDHILQNLQFCSKTDLLQLMFFIGLQKKSGNSKSAMRKCLKTLYQMGILEELNINDLCIICNSTFKTSTKISNGILLEKVKFAINDDLSILKDPALFITLIKTLRHNRFQDDDILNTISCTILFNKLIDCYSFGAICHILALYADYLYYDEHILKLCVEICMKHLQDWDRSAARRSHIKENIRVKDIKRFLWAVSTLGYENIDPSLCKSVIVPRIMEKIEDGEFENEPDSLIECVLYLWMLNYKAFELFSFALTPNNIDIVRAQKSQCKHRLNLLLSAIHFENRDRFKELNLKPQGQEYNLNFQVGNRPLLRRVYESLKLMSRMTPLNVFEMNFQVPYLNIVGITGYKNKVYKAVNIELLDDYTSVKNRLCYPSGLMQMKLRILRKLEVPVITICQSEIQLLNDTELKDYLKDEMEFIL